MLEFFFPETDNTFSSCFSLFVDPGANIQSTVYFPQGLLQKKYSVLRNVMKATDSLVCPVLFNHTCS